MIPTALDQGDDEFLLWVPGILQDKGYRGLWTCSGEPGTVTATVVEAKADDALPRTLWDDVGLQG